LWCTVTVTESNGTLATLVNRLPATVGVVPPAQSPVGAGAVGIGATKPPSGGGPDMALVPALPGVELPAVPPGFTLAGGSTEPLSLTHSSEAQLSPSLHVELG
jgi:hypothetical protein